MEQGMTLSICECLGFKGGVGEVFLSSHMIYTLNDWLWGCMLVVRL